MDTRTGSAVNVEVVREGLAACEIRHPNVVLSALAAAHDLGITHGGLRPDSILLVERDGLVLQTLLSGFGRNSRDVEISQHRDLAYDLRVEVAWESLTDEELLRVRICDLQLRIDGSELTPRVEKLQAALDARGILLRPICYLGAEWQSPNGVPAICIPFYLAHPRLKQLEMHQMLEIEGGTAEACDKLLFHECGHAVDHGYGLSSRRGWRAAFGDPRVEYNPTIYHPRPYSKAFVRSLPNWYAQSHPDEDFAETFAVWLALTPQEWREQYAGWKALEKLEYIERMMRTVVGVTPKVTRGRLLADSSNSKQTLGRHYAWKRKLWSSHYPDFYDVDLRKIFGELTPDDETAAVFMRRHRRAITRAIVNWTGEPKYTVDRLTAKLITRAAALKLGTPRDESALLIDIGSYLSALVSNYLYTGRFKKKV